MIYFCFNFLNVYFHDDMSIVTVFQFSSLGTSSTFVRANLTFLKKKKIICILFWSVGAITLTAVSNALHLMPGSSVSSTHQKMISVT